MHTTVAIIGGGLAGLCAARRLHAHGIDVAVVDARDHFGGRILSADGFDLGPSWFWPHAQRDMAALVSELGLTTFPQHDDGDVIFERMSRETPVRYRATAQAAQTMRITGGTGAVIQALCAGLPRASLLADIRVTHVHLGEAQVTLTAATDRAVHTVVADQVIAALPPRLLADLAFSPAVDPATLQRWTDTPTWMAPHAKFFALYDRPFWREAGLSGTAQSLVGPMAEIHDATTAAGKAALFGFLAVGADMRASVGDAALSASCLAQLARLFGPDARPPRATLLKDWAADPFTATPRDHSASGHPQPSSEPWISGVWQTRLTLCGSETSDTEPGFMAGAVSAAHRAAREVVQRLSSPRR